MSWIFWTRLIFPTRATTAAKNVGIVCGLVMRKIEGWIEARNIMPDKVLENARKLADEDKGIQPQATGQLHAGSNLRLSPDRNNNENIMMRLDSGSTFEIIGWKRVPKCKGSEPTA